MVLAVVFSPITFPFYVCFVAFAASLSLPSTSSSFDDETWAKAVHQGSEVYQQLQSRSFPDIAIPPSLGDLLAHGWDLGDEGERVTWPPLRTGWFGLSDFVIRTMGWTETEDYYMKGIRHGFGMAIFYYQRFSRFR